MLSGGGESSFPRSAAAVVALNSAGIYISNESKAKEITNGLDYLTQFRPEKGVARHEQYYEYGHYYAVQALWQAGGERWARWYPAIRDELIARQGSDGSWTLGLRVRVCHGDGPHHLADAGEPVADLSALTRKAAGVGHRPIIGNGIHSACLKRQRKRSEFRSRERVWRPVGSAIPGRICYKVGSIQHFRGLGNSLVPAGPNNS